jgi:hypothetical protein
VVGATLGLTALSRLLLSWGPIPTVLLDLDFVTPAHSARRYEHVPECTDVASPCPHTAQPQAIAGMSDCQPVWVDFIQKCKQKVCFVSSG